MTIEERPNTPAVGATAPDVTQLPVDPERTICLPDSDDATFRAALAALANSAGGHVVLNAGSDWTEHDLARLTGQIDPPLAGLVSMRTVTPPGAANRVVIVDVHQSPYCPHIDEQTGTVYQHAHGGIAPVTSRLGLDRLYRKGRAADERAQRSIDGMVERMQLASFGHYGLAVLACLRVPSAEPYLWAAEHTDELASVTDPFVSEWAFTPSMVRVRPGEIELRGERDVTGVLRLTRAGCVAVGETRRRPQGDIIGTPDQLRERMGVLLGTAWRVLSFGSAQDPNRGRAQDPPPQVVPRLLCEGLRSTRVGAGADAAGSTATIDTLAADATAGDMRDAGYRGAIVEGFMQRFLALYGLDAEAPRQQ